jgi:ribonuclease P/MRP protein subunit POP5
MIWAALTFMTKLPLSRPNDLPVVVKVVRVSGTIKKAEEEVIRRAKEIILRARLADGDADEGMMNDVLRAVGKRKEVEVGDEDDEEEEEEDSESD